MTGLAASSVSWQPWRQKLRLLAASSLLQLIHHCCPAAQRPPSSSPPARPAPGGSPARASPRPAAATSVRRSSAAWEQSHASRTSQVTVHCEASQGLCSCSDPLSNNPQPCPTTPSPHPPHHIGEDKLAVGVGGQRLHHRVQDVLNTSHLWDSGDGGVRCVRSVCDSGQEWAGQDALVPGELPSWDHEWLALGTGLTTTNIAPGWCCWLPSSTGPPSSALRQAAHRQMWGLERGASALCTHAMGGVPSQPSSTAAGPAAASPAHSQPASSWEWHTTCTLSLAGSRTAAVW